MIIIHSWRTRVYICSRSDSIQKHGRMNLSASLKWRRNIEVLATISIQKVGIIMRYRIGQSLDMNQDTIKDIGTITSIEAFDSLLWAILGDHDSKIVRASYDTTAEKNPLGNPLQIVKSNLRILSTDWEPLVFPGLDFQSVPFEN